MSIIAGHRQSVTETDWSLYKHIDTLIILMGVENRVRIADALIRQGCRPACQPVAFVERASTPHERVIETTLAEVAAGKTEICAPAVFVIGEVVRLRYRTASTTSIHQLEEATAQ